MTTERATTTADHHESRVQLWDDDLTEINELAARHNAINLGQGRPDFDGRPRLSSGGHGAAPLTSMRLSGGVADHAAAFYNWTLTRQRRHYTGSDRAVFSSVLNG
jgi:hypothetical protein